MVNERGLLLVDLIWIKNAFSNHIDVPSYRVDLTKETASKSGVACSATDLVDLNQQGIRVAVEVKRL